MKLLLRISSFLEQPYKGFYKIFSGPHGNIVHPCPGKDLFHNFQAMRESLIQGDRIEIRGFGSFSLHYREPRKGRNPKTGDAVELTGKYVPHFKPGKELRERVNLGLQEGL